MYKINSLRNMRFAEGYSRWISDNENLRYYKLKYAAQLGEDMERLAFNYLEKEEIRKHGVLYSAYQKRGQRLVKDRPAI
jgi:hypothetical protein